MPLTFELGRREQALIREPGDLPMMVVPQPGGVYRMQAGAREFVRAARHERLSFW